MKKYQIEYSSEAQNVLDNIAFQTSIISTNSLNLFYKTYQDKLQSIKLFPKMYPKLSKNSNIRKIPIDKYIILYQISDNIIHILNIIPKKSKFFN